MSYKNTMKLFASNFMLVWKQLLYLFIVVVVFGAIAYSVSIPFIDLLKSCNAGEKFISIFKTAYNSPSELFLYVSNCFRGVFSLISENFGHIYLSLIGLFFFGFIFPFVLIQMSIYNINSILFQKLTMNMEANYFQNGVKTLKHSILYALTNILLNIPYFAILVLLFFIYLQIATTILGSILGLVGLSALLIILRSIKISLFTCYTGYMVEHSCSPFVAFGKGIVYLTKQFWKVLSTSIIMHLTIIFVISFIAVFTFLSGLIVLIPAAFILISTYNLVIYQNIKGERYYLGSNVIFNPVQYKVKTNESLNQTNIPEEAIEISPKTKNTKKKCKNSKSNIKK